MCRNLNCTGSIKTVQATFSLMRLNPIAITFRQRSRRTSSRPIMPVSPAMMWTPSLPQEWTRWEMATSRLFPDPEYLDKAEDLDFAVAFARIECHYFINAIFVEEAYILKHADTIQHSQPPSSKADMTSLPHAVLGIASHARKPPHHRTRCAIQW